MKRRILPMFMAVIMILSIIQVPAWATDGETQANEVTDSLPAPVEGVITLTGNVTLSSTYSVSGELTLDLAGYTITGPSNTYAFSVEGGASLTITGNGTITGFAAVQVIGNLTPNGNAVNSTLTVESGTLSGTELGILFGGNGAKVVINGGEISGGDNAGIMSNGTVSSTTDYGGSTLEINGGTIIGNTRSEGWRNCGVYLPQNGTTTINGGTIIGTNGAGIVLRAGTLTITGGTIEGHGTGGEGFKMGDTNPSYCGGVEIGYSCNYPGGVGNITISGGTFTSETSDGLKVIGSASESTVDASKNSKITVSGGTFTNSIDESYLASSVDLIANNDGTYTVGELTVSNAAAVVTNAGGTSTNYYGTLAEAINAAQDGQTVTLLADSQNNESVTINDGRKLILDLNGHSAGFAYKKNISIYHGGLNIIGSGMLYENVPYFAPVMLYGSNTATDSDYTTVTVGENVTLRGWSGLFIDQLESNSNGANAYGIVITAYGTIESVKDNTGAGGHALYVNGTIKATEGNVPQITLDGATLTTEEGNGIYLAGYTKTTITDSTITSTGKDSTGIEIRAGELEITNSVISGGNEPYTGAPNGNGSTSANVALAVAQHTTKLPIKVVVNSGTFTADAAFVQSNPQKNEQDAIDKVSIEIKGGTFNGQVYSENKTGFISGGTFSSDPSAYVAPGKIALVQNNGMYTIADKNTEAPAEVVAGEPAVALGSGVPEDKQEDVKKAVANIEAAGLTGEANTEANNNTVTTTDGKNALENAGVTVNEGTDTVTIVVQPYLDITVTGYSANAETTTPNTMTLDITPMVRTVATTDPDNIELGDKDKNAVVMETAKELDVKGSITLTIPLPTGFANADDTVYIQHKDIYEYTAKVENGTSLHITFVNPHGFSVFTVSTTSAAVAEVDGTSYTSFQAAVDAVKNNGTITLVNDCDDTATVSRPVTFTLDTSIHNFTGSIVAGNGYTLTKTGDKYVVTRTPVTPVDPDDGDDNNNSGSSSSVRRYNIEADAGRGGDISPDGRVRVRRGENQTFRITADDGWEIADVEVDGESVGAVERYTFENVRTDHTISATFRQIDAEPETPTLPFTDVAEGDWYYDAVAYCWENGIMDGTSGTAFAPNMLLNRAMMAQVLYNLAGGTPAAAAGFPDVSPTAWYADAVNWAAANGYVTGYDNGLFGPEDGLTREQMAAILYRYAGSPAPAGSLDGFADAASASAYAVDALRWAVGEGLLTGKDGGRLDPTGTASRAELAQILARFAG